MERLSHKGLNKLDVFVFAFGAMIGWGWVILSGEWIRGAGSVGAAIAFVIGGVITYFVGLTYAELTSAMPENGGVLHFSTRALGGRAAFICTWAILLAYFSVIAFEAVALPTVIEYLFPDYLRGFLYQVAGFDVYGSWVAVGVGSSLLIALINIRGVKSAMRLQTVMTLLIFVVGLLFLGGVGVNGSIANTRPLFDNGVRGLASVAIMTPFLYVGFEVIPQVASEMNIPFKKIGQILMLSVMTAVVWYVTIIMGVSCALDEASLHASSLPTADAMALAFGGSAFAAKVMILAGIAGIVTSWNSFYVACSYTMCAMAEQGLLPKVFAQKHKKHGTPVAAMLLICGLSTIAPLFGRTMLVWLSNAGSFGCVVCNAFIALSFLRLRKREPELARPYLVKKGRAVGLLALALSCGMALLYLPGSPSALIWYEWVIILGWALLGFILYLRASRSGAA